MSAVGDFLGDTVGGITGAKQAGEAGERAAQLQAQSADLGVEENRRQFDKLTELLSPYVDVGGKALEAQSALLGLEGDEAQALAIENIEKSPFFQTQIESAEEALLQNRSATGDLRGGNTALALAELRPSLLNANIMQRYANLGGLTNIGQSSAAGTGAAGQASAQTIADLLGQKGAALAGGQLAQGNIVGRTFGDVLEIAGTVAGAKKAGLF